MSVVILLFAIVGGALFLGLSLMAKVSNNTKVGLFMHKHFERIMLLSTLLVPAVVVLSACSAYME